MAAGIAPTIGLDSILESDIGRFRHRARNFGHSHCKPDVRLQVAAGGGLTWQAF